MALKQSSREYNKPWKTTSVTRRSTKNKIQLQKAAASVNEDLWIKQNINMRQCHMPSYDEKNKEIVRCGITKKDHIKIQTAGAKQEWNFNTHTESVPTNAFGKIQFDDNVGNIERKFVRVDIETNMSKIMTMLQKWGMEKPKLIISVTGDEKDIEMDHSVQDAFESGLMKAAHSIGAWIITGGTHAGVAKHVGEAVRKNALNIRNQKPAVAIGIAPWGVIQNRRDLERKEGTSGLVKYHIKGKPNSNECFLDPNHSHYILVDDGIQQKIETENNRIRTFRADMEREICKMSTDKEHDVLPVLILLLVLGGRSSTLETVKNALTQNTPVVIVEGSGGAADILAYALKNLAMVEDEDKDNEGQAIKRTEKLMTESLECTIKKKMEEQKIDCNIDVIKNCLAKSDLIHIFEMDRDSHGIDAVMLKALLKANKDLVKNNITAEKTKMTFSLDDIMMYAIQSDSADFVKLLLNNGVRLERFLTVDNLLKLYNNAPSKGIFKDLWLKKKEEVSLQRMCSKKDMEQTITLKDVMKLVQDLVGDNYLQHYTQDRNEVTKKYSDTNDVRRKDPAVNGVQKNVPGVNKLETKQHNVNEVQTKDSAVNEVQTNNPESNKLQKKDQDVNENKTKGEEFENPCLDLFIWSVLNNEQDKAKLFWLYGKDKMAAALVAHALFSAMAHQIDDRELREEIDENSTEFMALAIKVARKCYETDRKKTQDLLKRKMKQWGNTTCIEIAVNAHDNGFISLQVCLDLFDEIWMGGLKQKNNIIILLACMVFPPLILVLARFHKKDDQLNSSSGATTRDGQRPLRVRGRGMTMHGARSRGERHAVRPENRADQALHIAQTSKVDPKTETKDTCDQVNDKSDNNTTNDSMHNPDDKVDKATNDNRDQANVEPDQVNEKSDKAIKRSRYQANENSDKARDLTAKEKFTTFYNAPIIKFMYNVISFIVFLSLYSYFLIGKLDPNISALEIILCVWVTSFLFGEIIQVVRIPASSNCKRFQLYIADGWNVLDMLTILLFISGAAVLMSRPQPVALEAARVVLGLDLVLFFLRILHIFHAHRQIGPKLVMITKMVWDLGSLAAILGVFILAYAIASYGILYPDTELTIDTVMAILKRPYWNIYGDLMLEDIEGADNCSNDAALYRDGNVPRCPTKAGQYVVPVMMGIYMLMTNIMLLSLLIATFSYSIEKVQQQTDLHCSIHRYNLICEYYTKSWLAHPFSLLVYLLQSLLFVCGKYHSKCDKCHSECAKCQSKCGNCHSQFGKCHHKCAKCHNECDKRHRVCKKCQSKMQCEKCLTKCAKGHSKMQSLEHYLLAALTLRGNAFKQKFDEDDTNELRQLEESIAAIVYQRMERNSNERIDKKVNTISERLDQLVEKFDKHLQTIPTKRSISSKNRTGSSVGQKTMTAAESSSTMLETKKENIEGTVKNMETKLDSISEMLQSIVHKLGDKQTILCETDVKAEGDCH